VGNILKKNKDVSCASSREVFFIFIVEKKKNSDELLLGDYDNEI